MILSSSTGMLLENGVYRINMNGSIDDAQGGWGTYSDMLYSMTTYEQSLQRLITIFQVDQPFGTGFTYADNNETDITIEDV
jgi:carboxypeptidase C (cathepsin A)